MCVYNMFLKVHLVVSDLTTSEHDLGHVLKKATR